MSDDGGGRKAGHVRADEVEWVESKHGEHHQLVSKQLGKAAGGERLGCTLVELAPGKRSWPYHFHLANEEAIYVLEGRGLLRLGGELLRVEAGSYVALPAHPSAAHQMLNDTGAPLRYLCMSTMEQPDVAVYPDSNKVAVFGGTPPGGNDEDVTYFALLRGDAHVTDYWAGEDRPVSEDCPKEQRDE